MNEYGEMFYGTLPPDTQDFRQVLAGIGRTIRERAAATGQRFVESAREARALQDQAFGDPTNPLRITDERALARLTDMIMGGPLGFAPAGITKAISSNWKLPSNYDDVTKLPIPKEFGGLKTEDYLFHGGVTDKLKSAPITSFSKSPQEALEYTTVSGGNIAAIPKSALKIYEGGNEKLTKAIFDNDLEALKKAGYDGFDLRSVAPGGYREVMVWNLDKALDKAVYAPVGNVGGEIGITQPLAKGLLGESKNTSKFNIIRQDASDIFGPGTEKIRYEDKNSGGFIDVVTRPNGITSVLGLEVPEGFRGKGIGESLQSQVLQDFPMMQGQVSSKAAATTAYRIGRRPPNQPNATLEDVYKLIDENSSVNLVSPEMQKTFQSLL